jgi:hypothetical protein
MKRTFILSFILSTLLISCKKDAQNLLYGTYTENSPVAGRSQLNFINDNTVIKTETGSNYSDTFNYIISQGKISLALEGAISFPPQKFDFQIIDDNTFKIENLYADIPEAPESFMTYKK